MKITIIGTGYVGLVSGACLAELGHQVICLDVQVEKIEMLNQGKMPIYEQGLDELVHRNVKAGRLSFTSSYEQAIPGMELISMAVGTPSADDGSVDMQYVWSAAREISKHLTDYVVIADKSTVPVGTAEEVEEIVREGSGILCDVVSNPEFLREGHAVFDFLQPPRIVIGSNSKRATETMLHAYEHVDCPKFVMDRRSAELTKYAANAFLATKISFINEMAMLAEELGADVTQIAAGIGSDPRIGKDFLRAGLGWGGSCFPKDVRAIRKMGESLGVPLPIVNAAFETNAGIRKRVIDRLEKALGSLNDKKVAVLGLAFKDNTDDTRESAAIDLIRHLKSRGADVRVHDPVAKVCSRETDGHELEHIACPYETCRDAHAVIIATEWEQFRTLDLARLKEIAEGNILVDARNLFDPARALECGWRHISVGR
ncbi:MAG: UDP-glucose/GDP-mannose dehydrogenase family protein [Patescibacteria group bacterium]|nr:UDP-glucose/GDP-mannose dehydrogenase family protein [Patescibacteria group bacterium]